MATVLRRGQRVRQCKAKPHRRNFPVSAGPAEQRDGLIMVIGVCFDGDAALISVGDDVNV